MPKTVFHSILVLCVSIVFVTEVKSQTLVDSLRVYGKNNHVQGIAYDAATQCFYCSFTTAFYKINTQGEIIGEINQIHGHLGAMTFDSSSRKVYASLECKDDEIGRGISKEMGKQEYRRDESRFYVAEIDVDKMSLTTHELPEVRNDYLAKNYGCSGIDGVTIAPAFGHVDDGQQYLYVAYGIYGDTTRTDNDYNILLCYALNDLQTPLRKYFVHTGNTTYGVQNLAYDNYTKRIYMAVYPGRKKAYPNYKLFALDMRQTPFEDLLLDVPYHTGKAWQVKVLGGWNFKWGSTGLCPLGNGYYYVSENGKHDGRQYCDLKLYRANVDETVSPFAPVHH
ncbi:MAG: hypothetical protein Q4E55_04730 [Bacteroidales bacterium]|nr:hypothetical protein [Bacteroidales bacterium]